ncbi:MAG: thermonuclease family protein [Sedimentisphaeraceae bacterium JB056]
MANKKQTKKTSNVTRNSFIPRIVSALIFFLFGAWIGNGGVNINEGKISFTPPNIQHLISKIQGETNNLPVKTKPAIIKPVTSFFDDGYGNCTVSEIISVYDGDTFRCNIDGLPDIIGKNISIRIRGIDTPEMKDKNPYIQARAIDAREFAKRKLLSAETVELKNIDRGKYFRILADVYVDKENLSEMMLKAGLANPYDGGTKQSWE